VIQINYYFVLQIPKYLCIKLVDKSRERRSLLDCFLGFIIRAKQIVNYLNSVKQRCKRKDWSFWRKTKPKKLHLSKAKSQSDVCWRGQVVDQWSDKKNQCWTTPTKLVVSLKVKV